MLQLIAHLVGDFWLQSDWMAANKYAGSKRRTTTCPAWLVCAVHAVCYTLPFMYLTKSPYALSVICSTHWAIDCFALGARFSWLKNRIMGGKKSWRECEPNFGYDPSRPAFIAVWLMIIVDNSMHLIINYAAIRWL